jgi:Flp pilus assembly protein TadB
MHIPAFAIRTDHPPVQVAYVLCCYCVLFVVVVVAAAVVVVLVVLVVVFVRDCASPRLVVSSLQPCTRACM